MFHKHQQKFQLLSIKTFPSHSLTNQLDITKCYLLDLVLSSHFNIPEILCSYVTELGGEKKKRC